MKQLYTHIKELIQCDREGETFVSGARMKDLSLIENAYLLVEDGLIADYGPMDRCPSLIGVAKVSLEGRVVLPTWCDSHTHLVYTGNRVNEFVDRINGLSYEEIAQRGGGILNSAQQLRAVSEEDLYVESAKRLEQLIPLGTGAIEIKSGYGLSAESELKMLRVIKRLNQAYPVAIKATFLGAHAVPEAYQNKKSDYLKMLVEEVLPQIAKESLAEYIDIFCETGYFSVQDLDYLLKEAKTYGLAPKVHVNQFNAIGGVAAAVQNKALSVDHLECVTPDDIAALQQSNTMPVALPGCSFYLGIPYTPARKLIDSGLPLTIATDYNPGSAPSGNMNFVVSTACIKMKMTPNEAINAATINGAYAMGLEKVLGSITRGKWAHFMVTKPLASYTEIPYSFGDSCIDQVYLHGNLSSY